MRKIIVVAGAVAVAGVAYLGGTWYVGKQAQIAVVDAVAQANERVARNVPVSGLTPDHFSVEIRSYRRGLFSSSAQYVFHTLDSDGKPLEYVLQDHLQHGPFPLQALREGKFAPMLAYSQAQMLVTPAVGQWFDAQQGNTPLSIQTQIGFGGKGHSHWTFSPFEISRSGQRVSFSGGYLQFHFNDGFRNNVADGHFDVYSLTDSASNEKIEVRDISLNAMATSADSGYFDQNSTFSIKELSVSGVDDNPPIVIDSLDVITSSKHDAGFLEGTLRYDIAHVLADGNDLGALTAAGSVSNLDAKALSELQATYLEIAGRYGADAVSGAIFTHEEQQLLQEKLRPVLKANPTLSLEPVVWKNASGQSAASALLVLDDPGPSGSTELIGLLQDLIARLKLDLSVQRSMVVGLFEQVGATEDMEAGQAGEMGGALFDEYADLLTEMGAAQLDKQSDTLSLSLDASPADNQVIFNGETLTLEQFTMRIMWLLFLPFA